MFERPKTGGSPYFWNPHGLEDSPCLETSVSWVMGQLPNFYGLVDHNEMLILGYFPDLKDSTGMCRTQWNLTWLSLGVKQQKRWLIRWDTQIVHPVVQWRFFQPLPMPEIHIQANCTGKSVNQWFDFGKLYRKRCGLTIMLVGGACKFALQFWE